MIAALLLAAAPISGCYVVDGDTIHCSGEKIRLLGIDAPEMPGHCARGRSCAPGDPEASKRTLHAAIEGRPVSIDRVGKDAYGRTLGVVYAGGMDLSCSQLAAGQAIYVAKWDNGRRVARNCPDLAR